MIPKIKNAVKIPTNSLISQLREVKMKKDVSIKPYKDCFISLEKIDIKDIMPAQRYVLFKQIEIIQDIKWQLEKFDIDIFNLDGYVRMEIKDKKEPIDLLPPVVEESIESNGRVVNLLNDGMHRLFIATLEWVIPQVIFIRGIPKSIPYYSYPIPKGDWSQVKIHDAIPNNYIKRWYRSKESIKLYRDFNSAFNNVQLPRHKKES